MHLCVICWSANKVRWRRFFHSFSRNLSVRGALSVHVPDNLEILGWAFYWPIHFPLCPKAWWRAPCCAKKSRHQKYAKKLPNINTLVLLFTQSSNFPRRWPTLTIVRRTSDFLRGVLYFSVSYSKGRYMLQKGKTDLGLLWLFCFSLRKEKYLKNVKF